MHRLIIILYMCLSAFHFSTVANASCTQQEFTGKAYDLKTNELLYQEQHLRIFINHQLTRDQVEYRDIKNKVFAVKRVIYNLEKSHPNFKLIDKRSQYIEMAELNNQKTIIGYQAPGKSNITQTKLNLPENAVHDAGFNEIVQKNWLNLQNGKSIPMQFLAPSRASYLGFLITPHKPATPGKLLVSLTATNKVFQWVIGQIDLVYDTNTQQLMQFKGLTNIKDVDKKNYRARIEYVYDANKVVACPSDLGEPLESFTFKDS